MRLLAKYNLTYREFLLFAGGLALYITGIYVFQPTPIREWFAPFISSVLKAPTLDPWTTFLQSGPVKSFPYGIAMLMALLPLSAIGQIFAGITGVSIGIAFTLLVANVLILALLRRLLPGKDMWLLVFWWLSPLVLTTNLWIGQLDGIPVALIMVCIVKLKEKKYAWAGIFISLAMSAKLSMALALPFVVLYFVRNKRMRPYVRPFFLSLTLSSLVLLGLPLFSPGYGAMALGTSELGRLFDLRLPLGDVNIFMTPVFYSLVVYAAWRTSFLTFDLFTAFIALGMLTIVLATPTPPGWQLWAWPFLVLHLARCNKTQKLLGYAFAMFAAASQILFWPPAAGMSFSLPLQQGHLYEAFLTILFSMGLVLILGVFRNGILANPIYRFSKHPISIAVAGDSGVGKDTLVESITGVLGKENTAHISGDDYHHWDRKNASWQIFTHLNPKANDLKRLFADIDAIMDGKHVTRRHYRHSDGRFSQPFSEEPQHFFIASGLHMLISDATCDRFDVRVFLEMEDELRVYFKCRRDMQARGHTIEAITESIKKRKPDGERYITPQRKRAEIVFVRRTVNPKSIDLTSPKVPATLLEVHIKHALYHDELARQLISLCGLRVDIDFTSDMNEVILTIDGDIYGEDMAYIAAKALPELEELIAVHPVWRDGVYGLMQLIILLHLVQKLKARS